MECALLFSLCLLWSVSTFDDVNGGVVVKEDSDAVLPCSPRTKENLETKIFDWKKDENKDRKEVFFYNGGDYYGHGITGQDKQFEGRVSHFEYELKNGNASIKIRKTKVSDSGVYTCEFPRLQPPQTFYIELLVDCILKDRTKEEKPGACPKPYVTSLKESMDWSLLQCKVKGASPRPKVEWRDSSGNILHATEAQVTERGGSYDIILNTTVTKTDTYSCVLTQNEICHQISSNISVYIHVSDSSAGWIVSTTVVITLIVVVIILAVLFVTGCISCREGFFVGWIVSATVVITLIVVFIILAALFATGGISCRKDSIFGWIVAVAVAVVITLIVVVFILAVLVVTGCISCCKGFLMKRFRHDDMRNHGDVTSDNLEVHVMKLQPRSDGEELNEDVTSDLLEESICRTPRKGI